MIELDVEDYCQNCPDFKSNDEKFYYDNIPLDTRVRCVHRDRCECIKKHIEKGLKGDMSIKYIYEMCKEHDCAIDLRVGPDGAMTITVYGKHRDHIIVGADWKEETIKECVNDVIRRANND